MRRGLDVGDGARDGVGDSAFGRRGGEDRGLGLCGGRISMYSVAAVEKKLTTAMSLGFDGRGGEEADGGDLARVRPPRALRER
jgi:hypothetical protein